MKQYWLSLKRYFKSFIQPFTVYYGKNCGIFYIKGAKLYFKTSEDSYWGLLDKDTNVVIKVNFLDFKNDQEFLRYIKLQAFS